MIAGVKHAELIAAALGAILAVMAFALPLPAPDAGPSLSPMLLAAILLAMTAWIAWQDARTFTIPDGPLIVIAIVAVVARLHGAETPALEAAAVLVEAAICGGALLALREAYFRYRGVDGLGFGDVKLAAAAGALLGAEGFAWALLLASLAALAVAAAATIAVRPDQRIDRLPFGAFLAPICWGLWTFRSFGIAG